MVVKTFHGTDTNGTVGVTAAGSSSGRYSIAPGPVILMPEGTERRVIEERGSWLADLCANHGFRFSTRMRLLLWRDKRGR